MSKHFAYVNWLPMDLIPRTADLNKTYAPSTTTIGPYNANAELEKSPQRAVKGQQNHNSANKDQHGPDDQVMFARHSAE